MKKIISLVLALALALTVASAFAVEQTTQTGTLKITNAAKGITYTVYKLLDATVDGDAIAYTYGTDGVLPGTLATYFPHVEGTVNNVDAAAAAKASDPTQLTDDAITAIENWLKTATAVAGPTEGNGTAVSFEDLPYGYYVITSTQGETPKITVATVNAALVEVVDKNDTEPDVVKKVKNAAGEWVEFRDANIGQEVQYKIESATANWHAPVGGGDQKQIKEYVIGDDLANSKLEFVKIDSVKVAGNDITKYTTTEGHFPITITWAENKGTEAAPKWESLYNNGVKIEIIYTAKLTAEAIIDTVNGNVNTADLDWNYVDGEPHFGEDETHLHDEAHTETYGIAFVKVNENGEYLSGAVFQLPFYVNATPAADGSYVYAGTTAAEGLTNSVTTPTSGAITIKGVAAGTYNITETQAPAGYNKLAAPQPITAVKISEETDVTETHKYWKIDEEGNVIPGTLEEVSSSTHFEYNNDNIAVTAIAVLNTTGTVLPSTGGIGTTIFYILGGLLVIGAAVILVARRKAQD